MRSCKVVDVIEERLVASPMKISQQMHQILLYICLQKSPIIPIINYNSPHLHSKSVSNPRPQIQYFIVDLFLKQSSSFFVVVYWFT